ncbi:MAG: AAA family ATPase [Alphaproteobacteria bacterium]|nr:AAA family ATPase [Alphaproteobacteria bacterium]
MKFDRVLRDVLWRLVIEGRVSYHSIRRDFGLDDAALEDLRYFLVRTKGAATDEGGRFLVWAGGASRAVVTAAADSLPALQPSAAAPGGIDVAPPERPPVVDVASIAADTAGAERRQLTVMFCDLVGSTDLASRLDPEDMADVIRAYHEAAGKVIRQFDGYIAKFMGDGILVYFGFPHAQEKDAARAVRTGLGIVGAMADLNAGIGTAKGIHLSVRIGIATGVVMVGESIGAGGGAEKTVVGETPNLAARLQGLAVPDGVVVSAVTRELAGDGFAYADLGSQALKGIAEPVGAWRVAGLVEAAAESDVVAEAPLLVGRDEEIGLLRRAWQQSRDEKRGQVVMVSGEPGIGKSTLIRTLRAEVVKQRLQRISIRCSQYHTNTALYPVVEHFKRAAGWEPEDAPETRLGKLEQLLSRYSWPLEDSVPLMATLMSLAVPEDRYPALLLTPQQLKQQTSDLLVALTLEEAEHQPVLQIYEDLHWADPSTLELIGQTIEQVPTVPLLMVLTFRPEFVPPWPPRSHVTPITLSRLERPQIEVMATSLADGRELPREVLDYVVRKTDGVPLYVEELTKTVLASNILKEEAGRYALAGPLSALSIPASLQEVLMARLDRLPTVREVAQLGAVFGREFAYEMLTSIGVFEEPKLRDGLGQLVEAELLYQRGRPPRATYTFKHALIQDAAYQSLLKRTRQIYHQQAAALLESRFPEVVEAQPELLAHHYAESGQNDRAVRYAHKAAQRAAFRSADHEVIAHATRALDLLKTMPESADRWASELALQRLLGGALMATRGFAAPEAGVAFERARKLCHVVSDSEDVYPVLAGIYLFEFTRANHQLGTEIAEETLSRAKSAGDAEGLVVGHTVVATSCLLVGAFTRASAHFEQADEVYQTQQPDTGGFRYGVNFAAAGQAYAGWCHWFLGRPDAALRLVDRALVTLRHDKHIFTTSRLLYLTSVVHQLRGDWSAARAKARQARKTAKQHGFPLMVAAGRIVEGAACAALGDVQAGIRDMRTGLAAYRATGARYQTAHHMALLADALRLSGDHEQAIAVLGEAASLIEETGERYYEAEVHRVLGVALLAQGAAHRSDAVRSLQKALEVARSQQAKSLELLAARDLAALWADAGERQRAHDLLASVFGSFSEGLESPALVATRQLVDALR